MFRDMLERALVKRLRDSDSDPDEENSRTKPKRPSTDKPTDILTTDKPTDTQVLGPVAMLIKLFHVRPGGRGQNYSFVNNSLHRTLLY